MRGILNIKKSIFINLLLLLVVFLLIITLFFLSATKDLEVTFNVMILLIIFFLLGIFLTVQAIREPIKGRLKKYLILTGLSAFGFFGFSILHNVFYALAELSSNNAIISSLMEFFHVAFFVIALIGCPIGFVIGIIGAFVVKN